MATKYKPFSLAYDAETTRPGEQTFAEPDPPEDSLHDDPHLERARKVAATLVRLPQRRDERIVVTRGGIPLMVATGFRRHDYFHGGGYYTFKATDARGRVWHGRTERDGLAATLKKRLADWPEDQRQQARIRRAWR